MIGAWFALVLSAPARLRGIFGIIDPTIRTQQMHERWRISLTNACASHALVRINITKRTVTFANMLIDPGKIRLLIPTTKHPLVGLA